jgi:hypothetical protein
LEFKGLELGMSDLGNEYLTLRDNTNTSNDVAWLSTSPVSQKRAQNARACVDFPRIPYAGA